MLILFRLNWQKLKTSNYITKLIMFSHNCVVTRNYITAKNIVSDCTDDSRNDETCLQFIMNKHFIKTKKKKSLNLLAAFLFEFLFNSVRISTYFCLDFYLFLFIFQFISVRISNYFFALYYTKTCMDMNIFSFRIYSVINLF